MSTFVSNAESVQAEDPFEPRQRPRLPPVLLVAVASLCAAAGLLTIYNSARFLLGIWLSDDLKSMGLVVPLVCYLLVLRAWRQIGWRAEGSWWGLAVLVVMAALMFVHDQMLLIVTVDKDWLLQLPPLPLLAVLYAMSLVLLFGGKPLLKAAWFPVLFMWAVIPVPQTFSRRVDLPLQHASAHVARAFAHALGQPLTQDKLRLMFTPEFGMFIAPGCNGIRGAITLGLAAIVVGYLFRFRWQYFVPVVAGSVLLGYLFNFLRLCLLVVYYKIALPYPWLQHHAKTADYLIGGCLFLCALGIFFWVADKLRRPPLPVLAAVAAQPVRPVLWRAVALLALAGVFGVDDLHQHRLEVAQARAAQALPGLPATLGTYTLVRTWNDTLLDGRVVYMWGEYADGSGAPGVASHVALGISPEMGVHDAEICHIARGEDPIRHWQLGVHSAGELTTMTLAMYNNGVTQRLEASTVCDGGQCRQFSESSEHVTLVYARPHRSLPLEADRTRPVPVLLKVETTDTQMPTAEAQREMTLGLLRFLHQMDLPTLTKPYGQR